MPKPTPAPPPAPDAAAAASALAEPVAQLRAFNRFYTRRLGVLDEQLLASGFSLAESRLLWELAHHAPLAAGELAERLQLDAGYVSRLLTRLRQRRLLLTETGPDDRRRRLVRLSAAGQRAQAPLEARADAQVAGWLAPLDAAQRQQLLAATAQLQGLLAGAAATPGAAGPAQPAADAADAADAPGHATNHATGPLVLRPHRPGDLGWIIGRHGALYAREHHWDLRFEALVARIAADFVSQFEPGLEACWIAESGPAAPGAPAEAIRPAGTPLGSIVLVRARDGQGRVEPGVAQLRLLLVEPEARGLGLGDRLVSTCEDFARAAGYRRMRLWTQSCLLAARRLYQRHGWQLVSTEPHAGYGQPLVGELWERTL